MEGSTLDRALWVALAITAGVAAGTAAAVTASAFPYAFGAAFSALRSKRKKEHREHRSHRYKSDKTKRSSSKPKEDQAYRDAIRRSLLEWKDIDVSLESFPYFLNENTKTALLDSMYVFLKRPEFTKYTNELGSVSPRILLTGPPGSEIYQETLVKGLAHLLQVNILVFDSTRVYLEASEAVPAILERVAEDSAAANQHSSDASTLQLLDGANGDFKETASVASRPSPHESRSTESTKIVRSSSSSGRSKESGTETTGLGPLAQLRTKSKGESNVDSKALANAVAAAAAAASVTATTVESRRSLKKGDRVKFVGASSAGLAGGLALISPATTSGGPSIGSKGRVLMVLEDNLNKVGVRFDKPVYGGNNLVDLCEDGHGFFCNVTELRLEPPGEDVDKLVLESLFEVLKTEAQREPLILFIRNVEKSILGNFERYIKLETLKDIRLVVIGSHTTDQQKEKGNPTSASSTKLGNNFTALLDLSFLDHLQSRMEDFKGEGPKASKMLVKLFPTKIHLQQPQEETQLTDWSRQLEQDTEKLKAEANRQQLRMV